MKTMHNQNKKRQNDIISDKYMQDNYVEIRSELSCDAIHVVTLEFLTSCHSLRDVNFLHKLILTVNANIMELLCSQQDN